MRENVQIMGNSWRNAKAAGESAIQAFEAGNLLAFEENLDACASAMQVHESAMSKAGVGDLVSAQDRKDASNLGAMAERVRAMTPGQAEERLALLRTQLRPAWDAMNEAHDAMHQGEGFGGDRQAISEALRLGGDLGVMIREMKLLQERMSEAAPATHSDVRESVQLMGDTWRHAKAVGESAIQAFEAGNLLAFEENLDACASVMQAHESAMSKAGFGDLVSAQDQKDASSLGEMKARVGEMTPGQAEERLALLRTQLRPAWDAMNEAHDAMHQGEGFGGDRQAISEALRLGGDLGVMIREMKLLQERMSEAAPAHTAPSPAPAAGPSLRENVQVMENAWREAEAVGKQIFEALRAKDVPRSQELFDMYVSAMDVHADSMSKVGIDDLLSAQKEVDKATSSAMSTKVGQMSLNQAWERGVQLSKELHPAWHALTVGFKKMHDIDSFGSDRPAISDALRLRSELTGIYEELQLLQKRMTEMMQPPSDTPPAPAMDSMRTTEIPVS